MGDHIVEFREDGWGLQHPMSCRPNLLTCEVHRVLTDMQDRGGLPDELGTFNVQWTGADLVLAEAGPWNTPVTMSIRVDDENPGHTWVSVFVGKKEGSRGNCGKLCFRTEEWAEIRPFFEKNGVTIDDAT